VKTGLFPRASSLGFGCASLGSRIGAKSGLAALGRALDRGVNWFDLAPSYGDGHAEEIFSTFSKGRRAEIYICTKCGIVASRAGALAAALRPLARILVAYAPGLRKPLAHGRAAATRVPLTGDLITNSIARSLRRLQTDYVDVLALHDPHSSDLAREDVRSELEAVVASGRARAVGIAGSLEAVETAVRLELPINHIQIANNPLQPQIRSLARTLGSKSARIFITSHSAFGPSSLVRRLVAAVRSDSELEQMLRRIGYELPIDDAIRAALIDYAIRSNPAGAVVFSMFTERNLAFNVGRAKLASHSDPQSFFDAIHAQLDS
jgi:aryl-alcohol dehydrogenase-like predicted oxidoreductase